MTRLSDKDKSELTEPKKRGRKKLENPTVKGIGLFDHVKHIRITQDPDYFKNLTELDKKSFNHFMILKALSMNPALLEDVSTLFRYFDKIPSPQFYKLLIGLIPPDHPKKFYPWVKAKKSPFSKKLIELISTYFEIPQREATEYATLLFLTNNGKKELEDICKVYGLSDKEIEFTMKGNDDEE
jgi:hypothetical protein